MPTLGIARARRREITMRIPSIKTVSPMPDAGYQADDDLRHRSVGGGRTRDSLFWEMILPEEQIGFQAYLYLTSDGKAGFNVIIWGRERKPLVLDLVQGEIVDEMDFDDFAFQSIKLIQPANGKTATLFYASENIKLEYRFTGIHDPFSYRQNPDGLPNWFAVNRLEQSGWVKGYLEFAGRRIELDRIGHRDHSWGMRKWGAPHHWKWLVAYTPDAARIVNAWIWLAKGEWGVGGYVVRDGELVPISHVKQRAAYDDDMSQRSIEVRITDIRGEACLLRMERFGIVRLPTGGRQATMIMEAACFATIDGMAAAGQFETQWPQDYLDRIVGSNKSA
jgi:hypothetical protein